jgi:hypothetical protein
MSRSDIEPKGSNVTAELDLIVFNEGASRIRVQHLEMRRSGQGQGGKGEESCEHVESSVNAKIL